MKTCTKCGQAQAPTAFSKGRPECKACARAIRLRKWAADPAARVADLARLQAYATAHPEKQRASTQRYNERNRDQRRAESRAWQKKNRVRDAERSAQQRALKREATPAWADKGIMRDMHKLAQIASAELPWAFHVDHIVPLNSPIVRGFHVEHNLTVRLAEHNIRKSNTLLNGGGLFL